MRELTEVIGVVRHTVERWRRWLFRAAEGLVLMAASTTARWRGTDTADCHCARYLDRRAWEPVCTPAYMPLLSDGESLACCTGLVPHHRFLRLGRIVRWTAHRDIPSTRPISVWLLFSLMSADMRASLSARLSIEVVI